MKCPTCKNYKHTELDLHSEQFTEDIMECSLCGTSWSINHGVTEIVKDSQECSFLQAATECVESDDYNWAMA
jgi:hypothetical protein